LLLSLFFWFLVDLLSGDGSLLLRSVRVSIVSKDATKE
jgi:hypothetical protein